MAAMNLKTLALGGASACMAGDGDTKGTAGKCGEGRCGAKMREGG